MCKDKQPRKPWCLWAVSSMKWWSPECTLTWTLQRIARKRKRPAGADFGGSHECYTKWRWPPPGRPWFPYWLRRIFNEAGLPGGSGNDDRDPAWEYCLWQRLGRRRRPVRSCLWGALDVEGQMMGFYLKGNRWTIELELRGGFIWKCFQKLFWQERGGGRGIIK